MTMPKLTRLPTYVILTILGLAMILPFYYMLITSFKPDAAAGEVKISLLPTNPTTQPYTDLAENTTFLRATLNSAIIAIALTLGNLILCPLAGYAFAKHRFPARDALFLALLSTMMVPPTVLLVPGFLLARELGWLNSWLPLIVPGLASGFGVFLARQFMDKIPDTLIEAARIDGCTELTTFARIVYPLCPPLLATLGIFTFLGSWNNFVWPLLVLRDDSLLTVPLVISLLQGRFRTNENIQMAGAVLSVLPVLIIFALFQRQIVASLASTGLKE